MTEERAKEALQNAKRFREAAAEAYLLAVKDCMRVGVSNTMMAALCGVSEPAIRQYMKRHNLDRASLESHE